MIKTSVNTRTAGINKSFYLMVTTDLQNVQEAFKIGFLVTMWVVDAVPDTSLRREVAHNVKLVLPGEVIEERQVAQITLGNREV